MNNVDTPPILFEPGDYKIWMWNDHTNSKQILRFPGTEDFLESHEGAMGSVRFDEVVGHIDLIPEVQMGTTLVQLAISNEDVYIHFKNINHSFEDNGTTYRIFADGSLQRIRS